MSTPNSYIPGFSKRKMKDDSGIKIVLNLYNEFGRLAIKQASQIFQQRHPKFTWSLQSQVTTLWELGFLDRDDINTWTCPQTGRQSSVYYIPEVENHPIVGLLREHRRAQEAYDNAHIRIQDATNEIRKLIDTCKSLGNDADTQLNEAAGKFEKEVQVETDLKKQKRVG